MDKKTKWRSFWLFGLVVVAVLILIPSFIGQSNVPSWMPDVLKRRVQYGLDLQGGLHMVYSIDLDQAVDDKASGIKRGLEADLVAKKIGGRVSNPLEPRGAVTLYVDDPANKDQMKKFIDETYKEVVVFRDDCGDIAAENVPKALCFRVAPDYADGIKKSALEQAILTIRERINERGVAEPSVVSKGDQIIVELPGLDKDQIKNVKQLIKQSAKLEFKIVEYDSPFMKTLYAHVASDAGAAEVGVSEEQDTWVHDERNKRFNDFYLRAENREKLLSPAEAKAIDCLSDDFDASGRVRCKVEGYKVLSDYIAGVMAEKTDLKIDDDHELKYEWIEPRGVGEKRTKGYWRSYFLKRPVELSGAAVEDARVYWNPETNRPDVSVSFDRAGGLRFGNMTGANVGNRMAILLDGKVKSAPTINTRIDGGGSLISMGGGNNDEAQESAQNLVNVLRTGSLPAPLQVDTESEVGPLLGRDAVDRAKLSFLLGAGLVIVIMAFYYRKAGMISIFALVLNLTFMMAILTIFQATLTLPGIAALVLTVGMAVDANIIIYERIREELRSGKSIKGAVEAGFSRGFAAILDGQLTTGAAGYVLYQYGSGPIKGFAVMLMIGIICTLFTATWCTRLFFEYYVGKGRKASVIAI